MAKNTKPKRHYQIAVTLPLTLWVEVDASSEEEALEKARETALNTPTSDWGDDFSTAELDIVKSFPSEYDQGVDDWWRHNGTADRQQASGLPFDGNVNRYLQETDSWWESLSKEEKKNIRDEFFAE